MRKGSLLLSLMAAACFVAIGSALAEEGRQAYRAGEVIVKYKDDSLRTMSDMDTLYKRAKAVDVKRFHGPLKNFEQLTFDTADQNMESVVADIERDPSVEYVQPNYLLYADDSIEGQVEAEAKTCWIPGVPYPPGCVQRGGKPAPKPAPRPSPNPNPAPGPKPIPSPGPERPSPGDELSLPGRGSRPGLQPRPTDPPLSADPSLNLAWGVYKIEAPKAWSKNRGSRRLVVAVVDTGIDYNHPDLAANVWRNPNYAKTKATGVDAQAQGISGDLVGWDFVHNDDLPFDDAGHGTHVSGTIGAVGSNGKGVSGVNQQVSIMAVKFLGANGVGDTAAAIRGIDYAISRGAKVINNSWGGRGGPNNALRDAIRRSADAGALFVASAGNEGTDNDSYPSYPASFNVSNMIAVAATNAKEGLASFSNVGARTVHLGAPGVNIYSTLPGGRYGYMSGTSMAAPHVSGAAALVWAAHPELSANQVKQRLLSSGDPLPSLEGRILSGRRLNVWKALVQ